MALSFTAYTGDGTNRNFAVTFEYISQDHVALTVDGTPVTFVWLSASLVQAAVAPANGTAVRVVRSTPITNSLVDFEDASTLTESDLDLFSKQSLYAAQEAREGGMSRNSVGNWDATSNRLVNLATPVEPTDATTKAYVDSVNGATNVEAAEAAAAAALAAKNAALLAADALNDVYLGAHDVDPALDNDGEALQEGALYFNSVSDELRIYNGSAWLTLSSEPAPGSIVADMLTDDPAELEAIRDKLDISAAAGPISLTEMLLALAMSEATSTLTAVGYAVADGFKTLGNVDVAGATSLDTSEAGMLKVGLAYGSDLTTVGQAVASGEASTDPSHDMGNAFDNTPASWFSSETGAATASVSYIGQDFGAATPKRIRRCTVLQTFSASTATTGVAVQYFNGSTWITAASATVAFNVKATIDFADVGSWRYWRVLNTAGLAVGNNWAVNEVEMFEGSTGNLSVASQLLPVASQPSAISAALRVVPTEALTLNTDIFVDVSRDGTTWTQAALSLSFTDGGTSVLTTNLVDVSGQPAGTTPRWRVRSGVTPKNYKLDGVALGFVS